MSAHIVSPPNGGTSRSWSTAPSAGRSRKVTSVCHTFSYVGAAPAPLANRTTSSLEPAASSGLVSNSPQFRAKSRCCSEVRCWARKNSTFHSSRARFNSSRSTGVSGRERSTPRSSAPMVRACGTTSKCS
ncbi:hypothetical protein STENM327S_09287 [Streptomyces tendae]